MRTIAVALVIVSQIASPAMAGGCFKKRFFGGHQVIHQKVIEQVCVPQVQQFHYFGPPSPLPEFQAQLAVGTLERQLQRVQDQFAALQQYQSQAQYAGYQQQATVQYAPPAPVQYAPPQQYQQSQPQTYAYQPPQQQQYYPQAQPQPPVQYEQAPQYQPPAQYQEQPQPYYPPQQQAAPQSCPTCPQPQQQAYPAEQYQQYPPQQQQHGYGQPAPQQHGYPQQQQPYQPLPHEQGYPQQQQQLPPQEGYAQQQPHATVMGARCLECHQGATAKAGLDFTQPLEFEERREVFEAARSKKMPKGGVPLSAQELGRMFVELFTPAEQAQLQRSSSVAQ